MESNHPCSNSFIAPLLVIYRAWILQEYTQIVNLLFLEVYPVYHLNIQETSIISFSMTLFLFLMDILSFYFSVSLRNFLILPPRQELLQLYVSKPGSGQQHLILFTVSSSRIRVLLFISVSFISSSSIITPCFLNGGCIRTRTSGQGEIRTPNVLKDSVLQTDAANRIRPPTHNICSSTYLQFGFAVELVLLFLFFLHELIGDN